MDAPCPMTVPSIGLDPTSPSVGKRYAVGQLLGRGGMGEVWRARDRLIGRDVALKRIRPARLRVRTDAAAEALRLTQEFRLLAGLHHPNIIGVSDYGLDRQGWPFFTMRLIEGATAATVAAANRDRPGRIRLLVQLFEGLAYLHRRGVLHRDLKPSNVLVLGDRLHIVDFGLSITAEEATQAEGLAGTLHYLAPELLDGAMPSERSDLYAAGLLAYEVLTGRHAFKTSTRNNLEQAIRFEEPVYDDPALADGLAPLLRQLLAKNPAERLQDHGAIAAVLSGLAGVRPPDPPEADGRDGLARAAPLVGRERELGELTADLMAAVDGNGRSRLVLGMVGTGKTRLWEELRPVALVRGALVVEGRSPPEGGQPFAPWRQALRPLVLECELNDRVAAVLKPLVPDIEQLIGRQVGVAPELDPGGTLGRLAAVIGGLVRDLGRTVVIAIEDLHWAGPESVDLLAILALSTPDLPLLLIGTARSDEFPGIAARAALGAVTDLRPLDGRALEELAAGTIGPAGRSRVLIELLMRESEGNPFFAIEVLRTLVERAGGWNRVESVPLPERLLVGGMRAVVARRLNRLGAAERRLAESAAIAGRDVDTEVLRRVEPEADWSDFLVRAAGEGLLDNRGGTWSFVHEQLRAALIDGIEHARRRELHRRIAEIIGQVAGSTRAPELAWHWSQADEPAEEARWAVISGEASLAAGAYRHALGLFERVVEIQRRQPRQFPMEVDPLALRFLAGDAAFRSGDLPKALDHLGAVLRGADRQLPAGLAPRVAILLAQVATQVAHRLPGGSVAWFVSAKARTRAALAARTWELLARLHIYGGDGIAVLLCALRATNLSENAGKPLAYAHGLLGCVAATARRWGIADGYFKRTRAIALASGDGMSHVDSLVMEAASLLGAGRFEDALERLRDARVRAEAIGYRLGQGQALTVEGVCHGYGGDNQRMLDANREALACIRHHSHGHQPGFRCGHAKALINLGRFTEARATLDQARTLVAADDRLGQALIAASLLLVAMREGDLSGAVRECQTLDRVLEGVTAIPPPCAQLLEAPAELVIARWHLALQRGDPVGDLPKQAEKRWKAMAAWSRLYRIGWPFAWWFRGHQHFLLARQTDAWAAWDRGLGEAVALGMPVYEGLLSLTLSKHGPRSHQRNHRFRARALFLSSQAMWHVRQVDQERMDEEDSGTRYQAWLQDEGSGTRTASYNLPSKRTGR